LIANPFLVELINKTRQEIMLLRNAIIVITGAGILSVGLIYAFRIIGMLRKFGLARPWILISSLVSFFLLGYVFTALRFLSIDLLPSVTLEGLVTAIFFFGAIFVLMVAVLNRSLFAGIFGLGISDSKAMALFAEHVKMPPRKVMAMTRSEYSVPCDICNGAIKYSIPDLVRAHPRLDRGVVVERAMGGVNYRFYVRHYCEKELREIPVRHDSQFEYRSHRPS
jgi:hypothetical protein